jgi:hypothetical protein
MKSVVRRFEYLTSHSHAVISCPISKLSPLAKPASFQNYDDLWTNRFLHENLGAKFPWLDLRRQVEVKLMPGGWNRDKLHYASLSLTEVGIPHYGDCVVVLRDEMIAHRTLVFEDNSALQYHRDGRVHPGKRCGWKDRGKMCVLKHYKEILSKLPSLENATDIAPFQDLVLQPGKAKGEDRGTDDVFVELIILGELTLRSFARIVVPESLLSQAPELEDACRQSDVYFEVAS